MQGEGREDGEGIVADIGPLHRVAIDEVLEELQRESQKAGGGGDREFPAAAPAKEEQQERSTGKRQPVNLAVQAHHELGPGGLEGSDDEGQDPELGEAAEDLFAFHGGGDVRGLNGAAAVPTRFRDGMPGPNVRRHRLF
jgi:hypothetical protein